MAEPPAKKLRTNSSVQPTEAVVKDALTGDAATWKGQPVVSVTQITPEGLELVMAFADRCKELVEKECGEGGCELLKGKIMAAVFYEASTRTNCSFQAAMMR